MFGKGDIRVWILGAKQYFGYKEQGINQGLQYSKCGADRLSWIFVDNYGSKKYINMYVNIIFD